MNKNNKLETEFVKEGSRIMFDIFGNKEIDLLPVIKKQRKKQVDDYDYNDPFFESFDGEFDPIDIECKLENFFIYKGDLVENPKKIIKKYNKESKKEEMKRNSINKKKKTIENVKKEDLTFSFEKTKDIKKYYKNKKEPIYTNLISWLFYYENELISSYIRDSDDKNSGINREQILDFNHEEIYYYFLNEFTNESKSKDNLTLSDELENTQKDNNILEEFLKENMVISCANVYTNNTILNSLNNKFKKNEITINKEERIIYLKKLVNNVETIYDCILKELSSEINYSTEKKTFLKFRSDKFMNLIIAFYMNYIKYYCLNSGEIIIKSKNKAFKYLSSGFNENCTNANRLKFYIRRYIEEYLVNTLKTIDLNHTVNKHL